MMHAGAVHESDLAQIDDRWPIVIVRQSVQRARQTHVRRHVHFSGRDNDIDVLVGHHVDAKAGGRRRPATGHFAGLPASYPRQPPNAPARARWAAEDAYGSRDVTRCRRRRTGMLGKRDVSVFSSRTLT